MYQGKPLTSPEKQVEADWYRCLQNWSVDQLNAPRYECGRHHHGTSLPTRTYNLKAQLRAHRIGFRHDLQALALQNIVLRPQRSGRGASIICAMCTSFTIFRDHDKSGAWQIAKQSVFLHPV